MWKAGARSAGRTACHETTFFSTSSGHATGNGMRTYHTSTPSARNDMTWITMKYGKYNQYHIISILPAVINSSFWFVDTEALQHRMALKIWDWESACHWAVLLLSRTLALEIQAFKSPTSHQEIGLYGSLKGCITPPSFATLLLSCWHGKLGSEAVAGCHSPHKNHGKMEGTHI